ncbi:MAG TPA: FAD-binding protein, partial [Dehalococcoidia bacterium]|nr:FAD-binding protein [Dehalococcoidia bacterium]
AFRHRAASLSHTGDGQLMAMAMGASFGNHPFLLHCRPEDRSFTTLGTRPKSQGPIREMPRISHWGIWVNRKGQRFIDESDESDPISTAIWRQPEGVAALVFDEGLRQRFPEEAQRYEEKVSGIFITAESVEELATKTGVIPPERLRATVQAVNDAIRDGRASELEVPKGGAAGPGGLGIKGSVEPWCQPVETPPFYAVYPVRSSLNTIWGGLAINPEAQVLDRDGDPIPGLYAAGAIFGGIFYGRWWQTSEGVWTYRGNYHHLSGSLPVCLTFGRIAGRSAALASRGRS